MAQIALTQKPLDIAIAGRLQPWTPQCRTFVPVAHGIGLVTLQTMLTINQAASLDRFSVADHRIGALVVSGWYMLPSRTRRRG